MHISSRAALHAQLAAATLVACALAACGGGSGSGSVHDGSAALAEAAAGLPASYDWRAAQTPPGGARTSLVNPLLNPLGAIRTIDSTGRFIASYVVANDPQQVPHAMFDAGSGAIALTDAAAERISRANAVNENALIAGTIDEGVLPPGTPRAFAWSAAAGSVAIAAGQPEPYSGAEFVSDAGLVAGRLCNSVSGGSLAECQTTFLWSSASSTLQRISGFELIWMNNGGDLLGHFQPPGCAERQVVVMTRDGKFLTTEPALPTGSLANLRFLADNGTVIGNLFANVPPLQEGAVAVVSGRVRNIGLGVSAPPPGATVISEVALVSGASRNGYAVGTNTLRYTDAQGMAGSVNTAFFWSEQGGTVPMRIEGSDLVFLPHAVNSAGVVVGAAGNSTGSLRAYVWTKGTGGVRLETLTSIGLREAWAIGEGGHILAVDDDSRVVLLTPARR